MSAFTGKEVERHEKQNEAKRFAALKFAKKQLM